MSDQQNNNHSNEGGNNKNQIDINLNEDVAQGIYSNLAVINHSSSEFILDFIRVMPGVHKADVKSRVILTPEHAKRFLNALNDNIQKYEEMYGEINVDKKGKGPDIPMNFGGPAAQA
ncbi:MAG: DUF3467 domain-containing protein [Bacteroidales bacterium]|jgi:hypothetical protein|nr:DUF3467 domain-containing protein [Bacteroidales bacterium]MBS3774290.1 DUF3467 domain-containing protein [Bacteroidales bacterium]